MSWVEAGPACPGKHRFGRTKRLREGCGAQLEASRSPKQEVF